jgi:polyisoprenoid-binding protein YceI
MRRIVHRQGPAFVLALVWLAVASLSTGLAAADPSAEGPQRLVLDPEASHVDFVLGATLHSAAGSLRLERGDIGFDPDGGVATGRVVLDARSANTGSERRDRNMHADVLESGRFAEIVFLPEHLGVTRVSSEEASVELSGTIEIHGVRKPLSIPATVQREGDHLRIRGDFSVPYVEWGMRDYSNFLLRVAPTVDVSLDLVGRAEMSDADPL